MIWSKPTSNRHNFLNPFSYDYTFKDFITLKSSSYFSDVEKLFSRNHFFNVTTYDFCKDDPSPVRNLRSWSKIFISYWILPISVFNWFNIIVSDWLISIDFKNSRSRSRIPEGGRNKLRFLNPVELFIYLLCFEKVVK